MKTVKIKKRNPEKKKFKKMNDKLYQVIAVLNDLEKRNYRVIIQLESTNYVIIHMSHDTQVQSIELRSSDCFLVDLTSAIGDKYFNVAFNTRFDYVIASLRHLIDDPYINWDVLIPVRDTVLGLTFRVMYGAEVNS